MIEVDPTNLIWDGLSESSSIVHSGSLSGPSEFKKAGLGCLVFGFTVQRLLILVGSGFWVYSRLEKKGCFAMSLPGIYQAAGLKGSFLFSL